MIKRRVKAVGLGEANCHTFRATGITAYLLNGGTLERAQAIAAHESPRTTKLYDRTADEVTIEDIEKIGIQAGLLLPILCRLLSLLDPSLGRTSLVVEPHDSAIGKREVCHDEADAREQFADAVLDFRHDRGTQEDA